MKFNNFFYSKLYLVYHYICFEKRKKKFPDAICLVSFLKFHRQEKAPSSWKMITVYHKQRDRKRDFIGIGASSNKTFTTRTIVALRTESYKTYLQRSLNRICFCALIQLFMKCHLIHCCCSCFDQIVLRNYRRGKKHSVCVPYRFVAKGKRSNVLKFSPCYTQATATLFIRFVLLLIDL